MSWRIRATSAIQKVLSRSKDNANVKAGMSSYKSSCESKSLAQPIDPVCCPAKSLMDEAIEPCGDWQENYDRYNAKNNRVLVGGTVVFLISCFLVKRDGFIKGYPYSSMY